jgi:general secretion pathway protein H
MKKLDETWRSRRRARERARGVTLVEVLITVAIMTLVSGLAILGMGAASGARLKRGATELSGVIRIAYAHATSHSHTVRLVFDFATNRITMEETAGRHLMKKGRSGGAEPATEAERAAEQEALGFGEGPLTPKAMFSPAKAFGFPQTGKELPSGIGFWQVEVAHQEQAVGEGRAYLYFFPNGQTETANIQIRISNSDPAQDASYMTVTVAPLTGKTNILKGRVPMIAPRDDTEASERQDTL